MKRSILMLCLSASLGLLPALPATALSAYTIPQGGLTPLQAPENNKLIPLKAKSGLIPIKAKSKLIPLTAKSKLIRVFPKSQLVPYEKAEIATEAAPKPVFINHIISLGPLGSFETRQLEPVRVLWQEQVVATLPEFLLHPSATYNRALRQKNRLHSLLTYPQLTQVTQQLKRLNASLR